MRDNYPELGRVCRTIRYQKSGPATMITLWLTNGQKVDMDVVFTLQVRSFKMDGE